MIKFADWLDENELKIVIERDGQKKERRKQYIIPHEWKAKFQLGINVSMSVPSIPWPDLRHGACGYGFTPDEALRDMVNTIKGKQIDLTVEHHYRTDMNEKYQVPDDLEL